MKLQFPNHASGFLKRILEPPVPSVFVPKEPGCLRVVTFNVHFGKDPAAIAWLFKNNKNLTQADVILLQEVEELAEERVSRVTKLARALKCNFVYEPARRLRGGRGTHGIAILSRLELKATRLLPLPYFELPLRHRPRIALRTEVELEGHTCLIYNVHLDTTLNTRERTAQLDEVLTDIQGQDERTPIILGGDFNTIPLFMLGRALPVFYSNQKKKLQAYLKRRGFETRCLTAGYTLRSGIVRFQLDGLYTKYAPAAACAVEREVRVSDHFPLWADFRIF